MGEETGEFFLTLNQRGTVVGEGNRHQTPSGQPTSDPAEKQGISQLLTRAGRGQRSCLETISSLQGIEPRGAVKQRGQGMPFEERGPAVILQRVDIVDFCHNSNNLLSLSPIGLGMLPVLNQRAGQGPSERKGYYWYPGVPYWVGYLSTSICTRAMIENGWS